MYYAAHINFLPESGCNSDTWLIAFDSIEEALEGINKMPQPDEWRLLGLIELENRIVLKKKEC